MIEDTSIMKYETTLPEDFNGVFHFTNWSNDSFVGRWGGKEYHFPAETTSPMIIPEHSPLEIQHIRKKFAKDLAEREYFKTPQYEHQRLREGEKDDYGMIRPRGQGMSHAGQYSLDQLSPYIQRCLEPLPVAKALVKTVEKTPIEENLTRNNKGKLNTEAIDENESLTAKALNA
jgi:hypothetical protein